MPYDNRQHALLPRIHGKITGRSHYQLHTDQASFVYCHIRKNASSSFKKMVIEQSQYKRHLPEYNSASKFMNKYHRLRSLQQIARYDHVIFAYRDPFKRTASLFCNKFIMMHGENDIFNNYRRVTRLDPYRATFDDFVELYLSRSMWKLDRHCLPQSAHLLPVKYTHAIPMRDLHSQMTQIVGDQLADRYFKKKTNASSSKDEYNAPSHDLPASTAHDRWKTNGTIPSCDSLLTDHTRSVLSRIYADDLAIIGLLQEHCA